MWETILNLLQSIGITIEEKHYYFLYQKYLKTSEALFYFEEIAFLGLDPETVVSELRTKQFHWYLKQIVIWNDLPFCRHNKPNAFLPKLPLRDDAMKDCTTS